MNKESFEIDFKQNKVRGDVILPKSSFQWLLLHGAGTANKKGFDELRKSLAIKGDGSCAFDFVGHGETGGDIHLSSLQNRVEQVLEVIKSRRLPSPISLIASSMSGYVALKLTELIEIGNLVLIAPAVYSKKAYSVPFGPEFSNIIRQPYSWRDSDAWEILSNYKGNLLILAAENDQVIPEEIIERIYASAQGAKFRKIVIVKGAIHSLARWLNEHPASLPEIVQEIAQLQRFGGVH